jgi:hypothetical protein
VFVDGNELVVRLSLMDLPRGALCTLILSLYIQQGILDKSQMLMASISGLFWVARQDRRDQF